MDVETIRGICKRQVNEPTDSDTGFWLDADYLSAINHAQREFVRDTYCLKTDCSFTTEADKSMYDLSEDSLSALLDIAQVYYYIDETTYYRLENINRDRLMSERGTEGVTSIPRYFCYEDRTIEFECDTEADMTVKIFYYYITSETALDDDADEPAIPVNFHQALVDHVCWKFCESDDSRGDKIIYYKNLYTENVVKAKAILEPPGTTYERISDVTGYYD